MNARSEVVKEADSLVNGDRNVDYGDPIQDFATTAEFWETYLLRIIERRKGLVLKPHDVAVMMQLLKISRTTWSPEKKDHWVDNIGYAACGWDCVTRQDL